jgi:4-hydroxybenzoate polyprenyltransferase
LIIPMWTIVILGMRAGDLGEGAGPFHIRSMEGLDGGVLLCLLLSTLLYGAVYIYNQIHDIESDRNNGKVFFLPQNIITLPAAYTMFAVLNIIALAGAFSINAAFGVIFLIIAGLGILYSHPKINYKGKAGKALWSNMFGSAMLPFLIGWVYIAHNLTLEAVLKSLPYFLAVGAVYLNTTLPDREGDKKAGKETYATIWKVNRLQWSALIRAAFAVLFAWMTGDLAAFFGSLLALPFFVRAVVTEKISDSILATKVAILLLSLFACIYFPPYLLIILLSILLTRVYYRYRFDFAYPKF